MGFPPTSLTNTARVRRQITFRFFVCVRSTQTLNRLLKLIQTLTEHKNSEWLYCSRILRSNTTNTEPGVYPQQDQFSHSTFPQVPLYYSTLSLNRNLD